MPRHRSLLAPALALLVLAGCERQAGEAAGEAAGDASVPLRNGERYDEEAAEALRMDSSWRAWAERDRARRHGRSERTSPQDTTTGASWPESFEQIRAERTNRPPQIPVRRSPDGGPSILHVQILLDRAGFSPGALDGRWGKNTEKAVYWFQDAQGLAATGMVDRATYARLAAVSLREPPVRLHTLTANDVQGPFVEIPTDVYEKAELDCLCYESPLEKVSERFHTTRAVIAQLNPGLDLHRLEAGTRLWLPQAGERIQDTSREIARIVVSRNGFYTHALDADGHLLFHFPSTLGTTYSPSPEGDFRVTAITYDPHFRYQPRLLHGVPNEEPEAMLQPGPNSPVGVVWMALSKPHHGIHGTPLPEAIGDADSSGCVRLTNWDAKFLADRTRPGTPVEFR